MSGRRSTFRSPGNSVPGRTLWVAVVAAAVVAAAVVAAAVVPLLSGAVGTAPEADTTAWVVCAAVCGVAVLSPQAAKRVDKAKTSAIIKGMAGFRKFVIKLLLLIFIQVINPKQCEAAQS